MRGEDMVGMGRVERERCGGGECGGGGEVWRV